VVLVPPRGERLERARTLGSGCNNEAELLALGFALECAAALGARALRVQSDSDFVVRHVSGEHHTAVARLHMLIERTQTLIAGFDSVELRWLPRHRNRDADRLARGALGLPDKPAAVPGQGAGRRKIRQKR